MVQFQIIKLIIYNQSMKGNCPAYLIKPKYIFKSPFLKYDLQNPTNRQAQNQELTEYFNYGFNEDTMNIYAKLVNRTLKVLDHKKNLQYFDQPSELMRLNDQIPMDFGGFCKFYDPQVFRNDFIKTDQQLLKIFLFNIVKATWMSGKQHPNYPILEFVKNMYRPKPAATDAQPPQIEDEDNPLPAMIEQISKNIERKYEETMRKLIEQKNQPKQLHPNSLPFKKGAKFQKRGKFQRQDTQKKQEMKKQKQKSSSSQSSSSSSQDSSSSSQSEGERRRRKQRKQRRGDKDKDGRRRDKRQRQKQSPRDKRDRREQRDKRDKKDKRGRDQRSGRSDKRDPRNEPRHDERDKNKKIKKSSHQRSRSRDHKRRHR